MKITDIKIGKIDSELTKTYKIGKRTINKSEEIIIKVFTEEGLVGYGSAVPTPDITGELEGSIICAIKYCKDLIIGRDIENIEGIMKVIDSNLSYNHSAKAAIDMALYDLIGKKYSIPLYKFFGGHTNKITTSLTINFGTVEEMVTSSLDAVREGYTSLKLKVGYDACTDIERITAIKKAIRKGISIRIDANQGWEPKEAVKIIRTLEDLGLDIDFVEQPVKYWDLQGLKYVTDNVETEILADESAFGPPSVLKIIQNNVADLISIKLMKCGGFHNAIKIYDMADTTGIRSMVGCMVESKIGITAAASLAVAKANMIKSDLDTILSFNEETIIGGIEVVGDTIILPDKPGLGIDDIKGWKEII